MADEPSGGGGVTPNPPSPVTGTPAAPGGVTPQPATLAQEDALKRIADLERSLGNAKEENDRHSKRLSAYEKAEKDREAAAQAAKDAQLSEIERVKKEHLKAEARIQQLQQENIVEKVINAAHKKGIIDPDLAALAILQDKSLLDENGMPTDLDKALDTLIKNKPYLVPAPPAEPAPTPAQTAPTQQPAPALPPFAGRSSIPGPGATPGRIPQWNEVFKRP